MNHLRFPGLFPRAGWESMGGTSAAPPGRSARPPPPSSVAQGHGTPPRAGRPQVGRPRRHFLVAMRRPAAARRPTIGAMKWPGGRGGFWSPQGHRAGWSHLQKQPSTGKLRVSDAPRGCIAQARNGQSGLPSVYVRAESSTRFRGGIGRVQRGRPLRSRMGAWKSRSSRSTTPPWQGRNVGGSRKAPSVSTRLSACMAR